MIDEKKIEEAAEECAMKHRDVAPFIKRGFWEGVCWTMKEITEYLNDKQNDK